MCTLDNILIFLFLCVPFFIFTLIQLYEDDTTNSDAEFDEYLKLFNKSYVDPNVYRMRLKAFKESLLVIEDLNQRRISNLSALYGLTYYTDLPEEELFDSYYLSSRLNRKRKAVRSKRDAQEKSNKESVNNTHTELNKTTPKISANKTNSIEKYKFKESFNTVENNDNDILNNFLKNLFKNPYDIDKLPRKIDWRERGVIGDVNDQESCGACWAFSVTEMIESVNAIRNGNVLKKLSVQELIDCAAYGNLGCKGGDVCSTLQWIQDKRIELLSDEEYPLSLKTQDCKLTQIAAKSVGGVRIKKQSCGNFAGNENYILYKLATQGPVAVAVNALLWKNYLDGVVHYHCSSDEDYLNHSVLIVGYNLDSEIPYYIVRNSWGAEFGQHGYIYISIGSNMCGIANEVGFVDI